MKSSAAIVLSLTLFLGLSGCTGSPPGGQPTYIDLTHPFDEHTIFWPTEEGFSLERAFHGITPAGHFYSANRFRTAEHGGTHLDAPIHFFKDRETVDEIPLERLIAPGVVIDVRAQCRQDPDYRIEIEDFREWEERLRSRLEDVIVLLETGFGDYWPDRGRYLGTEETGAAALPKLHFPGLHPEAARWLVDHRRIKAIGLDTASIDHGQSKDFKAHVILAERSIPIFENVARIGELPPKGFTIVALPMKIKGGSGGPLRILARLDP